MKQTLPLILAAQALVLLTGACATTPPKPTPGAEPSLKLSYGAALGSCSGTLTLYPDGRYQASARFDSKDHDRGGRIDTIYWDMAVDTLEDYRVSTLQSRDAYYHTIPPDAPDADAREKELLKSTDYIILDGYSYRLDWRGEDGGRSYLYDRGGHYHSGAMWKALFRAVRFEQMTCGHYLQRISFPE